MVDTYRLMSNIRLNDKVRTNEELAKDYAKTNDQRILAEIYCRNFKLISSIAYRPKYNFIDKSDKASIILQSLDNTLRKYDDNTKVPYINFACICIVTALNGQISYVMHCGRTTKVSSLDYFKELNDNEDTSFNSEFLNSDDDYNSLVAYDIIENSNLNEREKLMCKAIINDPYINDTELSEVIKVHRHTIRATREKLKLKLAYLV